jgi:hypothetical protein
MLMKWLLLDSEEAKLLAETVKVRLVRLRYNELFSSNPKDYRLQCQKRFAEHNAMIKKLKQMLTKIERKNESEIH